MSKVSERPNTMSALCRFCLSRKSDLQPIFDGNAALLRKINDIIQLEIAHDDGLPSNICQQCVFQLNTAHCFKQRCINSESRLRSFVAQMSESGLDNILDLLPSESLDNESSDSDADFDIPLCEVIYNDPQITPDSVEVKPLVDAIDLSETILKPSVTSLQSKKKSKIEKLPQVKVETVENNPSDKVVDGVDSSDGNNGNSDTSFQEDNEGDAADKALMRKKMAAQKKKEDKNLPVICEICGKLFKKNHLYYHRKLHSQERKFECTVCKKTFKMLSHLKRHERLHVGEKSFLCSYCGKSFVDSSNLRNHVRNHRSERKYACVTCGKAFARAETLTKHLRSHTGEKPFSCEICHRMFPRKDSLIRHMKSHRGERPHKCHICDRSFTQSFDLKLHIRKHLARQI